MHAVQAKGKESAPSAKQTEADSKTNHTVKMEESTRLPAWTDVWQDQPPTNMLAETGVQAKLMVNQPDDTYEQEADGVADQVMRMPEPRVPRQCACSSTTGPDGKSETRQAKRLGVQLKSRNGVTPAKAPASVHETIREPGHPLDASTRGFMESRLGHDFSSVRIHADGQAAESAKTISAHAYTVGQHIVFAKNKFSPGTDAGNLLLAHELVHVIQQSIGGPKGVLQRQDAGTSLAAADFGQRLEQEISEIEDDIQEWERSGQPLQAAYLMRVSLLLTFTTPTSFADEGAYQAFITGAWQTAENEMDTLGRLGNPIYLNRSRAFPAIWSGRVFHALNIDVDMDELRGRLESTREEVDAVAARVPDAITERGLPVPFAEAQNLRQFVLQMSHFQLPYEHVVKTYVRTARENALAAWPLGFLTVWNGMATNYSHLIETGQRIVDPGDYQEFVDTRQSNLHDLLERIREIRTDEAVAAWDAEITSLFRVTFVQSFGSLFGGIIAFGVFWERAKQRFNERLRDTDSRIAALSESERWVMALRWAWHCRYLSAAGLQLLENLIANLPEILGLTILFIIIQFIPFLNVAVDVALMIYSGIDAIAALNSMREAFRRAEVARTVEAMQRAAADVAASLVGDGVRILLDVVGIVTGYRSIRGNVTRLLRANPTMSEEAAVRQALRETRPQRRTPPEPVQPRHPEEPVQPQQPAERGQPRELTEPEPSRQPVERSQEPSGPQDVPELDPRRVRPSHPDLQPFCVLGSLVCPRGIPARVRDRVGEYPQPQRVPYPGGRLVLRGTVDPAYRALRRIRAQQMRNMYIQRPDLWTPEFRAAYNARRARWPSADPETWWPRVGSRRDTGARWQVHHRRPLDFGGDNIVENFVPLEPEVHSLYTTWWNSLKREISGYFSDAEWGRVIGGSRNEIFMPSDF